MVSGGPYTITKYQEKGTTVFKPNPYFYGPKSNAAAVTLTYYTNSTSMVADLTAGNLDFVDAVPYTAGSALKNQHGITLDVQPGDEVTNLGFNSNPKKTKNRELLNPTREGGARVRHAAAADHRASCSAGTRSPGRTSCRRGRRRRAGSTPR